MTFGRSSNVSESKDLLLAQILWHCAAICLQSQVDRWSCAVLNLATSEVFRLQLADYLDCLRTGTPVTLKRDLP